MKETVRITFQVVENNDIFQRVQLVFNWKETWNDIHSPQSL